MERTTRSPIPERRISRVTQLMQPLAGYADWEVTQLLSKAKAAIH